MTVLVMPDVIGIVMPDLIGHLVLRQGRLPVKPAMTGKGIAGQAGNDKGAPGGAPWYLQCYSRDCRAVVL